MSQPIACLFLQVRRAGVRIVAALVAAAKAPALGPNGLPIAGRPALSKIA
jgi:hypothetical protein